ncbi:MAG: hypothetical protein R3C14_07035 [Caldilineaceae bacterium]
MRTFYRVHAGFFALLVLFAAFHLLALLLFRPGGLIADASDYDFYYEWGLQGPRGYTTFVNLWTAYPPLFPALMLPVFAWSSRIPPWVEPRLFFHLFFGLELLLFECGNLILIYRLARKLGYPPLGALASASSAHYDANSLPSLSPILHPALLYALLFVPVYTMIGWFEAMPLFFMLLGLDLLLSRQRWGWLGSAVAAALGFLIKLTPALLVPLAIRWLGAQLSWRAVRTTWFKPQSPHNLLRPALYSLLFAVIVVGVGYPLAQGNLALALSSFRINSIRPPWQSVWALLDGYYGYGLVPLDMRNLIGLERQLWPSQLPWGGITLAFVLLYLWLYTRAYNWQAPRTPVAFAAVSVIWLFLYSKGWSPQFLVWILAFLVLLLPTLRGILLMIMLSLINVAESHFYLVMLPDQHWLMAATVITRTLLLVLIAAELLGQIWPGVNTGLHLQRVAAQAGVGVMLLALVGASVGAAPLSQAYTASRLAKHPCREAIAYLEQEAIWPNQRIVSDQIEVWRDFYPWLGDAYTLRVIDGYDPTDRPWDEMIAARLDAYAGQDEFWWVTYNDLPTHAARYFAQPAIKLISEETFGKCTVARVMHLVSTPLATVAVAGGPILLHTAKWGKAELGQDFALVLYWQAETPVTASYTVFVHLVDGAGQLVAQQDNLPVMGLAPTAMWQPGKLIRDPYRLLIPTTATPGVYQVQVGLYTDDGRQSLTLADGTTAEQIVFSIEVK